LAAPAAFAQGDDASGGGGGSATVGAGADANAGGANAGAGATVTAGGDATAAWPMEINDRPYNLPKAEIAAYGDIDILHLTITAGTSSSSATQEGIHVGGAFGVNEKLTVGGEYSAPVAGDGTDNVAGKGPLRAFGIYALSHDSKMTVAAYGALEMNLAGGFDMMGNLTTTFALHAGLDARYMVAPKIAIFTGSPFGPGMPGATGGINFPGFGSFNIGDHLFLGLNNSQPITFNIPVGVSLQATPQLFIFADTVLTSIALSNSPYADTGSTTGDTKSVVFIGDDNLQIPLQLGGFFSVNKNLDAGVTFLDNLKHAGDLYVIGLAARWYK
jgi:hypothetical protein